MFLKIKQSDTTVLLEQESAFMHKREFLELHTDIAIMKGLEFGPLNRPIVRKTDGDIFYLDHLSTEELKLKYYNDESVDCDRLVPVDYILHPEKPLKQIVGNSYDYIVASHVFEHLPNPIHWLEEIYDILVPTGKIFLVVPDKRFCFDVLRNETRTSNLIEAYLLEKKEPSVGAVFDFFYNGFVPSIVENG